MGGRLGEGKVALPTNQWEEVVVAGHETFSSCLHDRQHIIISGVPPRGGACVYVCVCGGGGSSALRFLGRLVYLRPLC